MSLGCAKNTVDLQIMGGALMMEGIELATNPDSADVILVNTCAFIQAARDEANDEILRACELKRKGRARYVVVSGCLPQRYGASLASKYPEVDGWLGIDHLFDLPGMIRRLDEGGGSCAAQAEVLVSKARNTLYEPPIPEFSLTGGAHAYLKIAEGCNHACAYCAIPEIRGRLRSRLEKDIIKEARALIRSGARELDIVGQDVTAYGRDLHDGTNLVSLLSGLDRIRGDFRLRLLYGYPAYATDALLEAVASSKHICRYIDIPVQHSHPDILRAMRRADTIRHIGGMVERIRAKCPGAAIRTTLIVGFPGETEDHFRHLLDYVSESRFDHLGVFCFSPEEGTPAATMDGQVPHEIAEERRKAIMLVQQSIVEEKARGLVGKRMRVLVDGPGPRGSVVARGEFQAPDVDGVTFVRCGAGSLRPGDFADVEVTGYSGYDIMARPLR